MKIGDLYVENDNRRHIHEVVKVLPLQVVLRDRVNGAKFWLTPQTLASRAILAPYTSHPSSKGLV